MTEPVNEFGPFDLPTHPTVAKAAYDPLAQELAVVFRSGVTWVYQGVPVIHFHHLIGADGASMFRQGEANVTWTRRAP